MPRPTGRWRRLRVARLLDRVVVDVDHVVEHAHRRGDGLLQLVVVELLAPSAVLQVLHQVDRAEVADRDLGVAGVQRDLGAQVASVHHAHVLLRRAHVAGVLEGDPGMPGLEQHRQHLAPQVRGRHALVELDLAAVGLLFVGDVGRLEVLAELVVQVGQVLGENSVQSPPSITRLHEQVGDPVGGVHVVRAAAVVAGVLAQLEELLDVEVPGFQVGADRALALAALVDRDGGVVDHLQERHHALALAVGALDVGAQRAHAGPVVAQAAGELGQQRVFLERLVDAVQVVGHGGQVAARQLRAPRAGVEQRRRARHEVEAATAPRRTRWRAPRGRSRSAPGPWPRA